MVRVFHTLSIAKIRLIKLFLRLWTTRAGLCLCFMHWQIEFERLTWFRFIVAIIRDSFDLLADCGTRVIHLQIDFLGECIHICCELFGFTHTNTHTHPDLLQAKCLVKLTLFVCFGNWNVKTAAANSST